MARLATVGVGDGAVVPHLVPVVFALDDDVIYTCVDHKPKRTTHLRRLANIAANPAVSLLVDHYSDDWDALWWVRVDGRAEVVDPDSADGVRGIDRLAEKYAQYREKRPAGPVIVIGHLGWHTWSAR
ncbi:hypothetical protein GORHZ_055_00690 [Gordonia rhizosphera NBRC 16068]|uniref:Pyridoxamine 5'-phosphate oxidase N-terminal domain-containing protein n=1 Tax=Gordonia rhizosphera NBRC 16068 TaxID=1108045 RepID=K6WRW7_9ACTN|nr:hypothetical protein GORHZ_055_00690 [Gordonia rhizosphera NBRC 16068]